MTSVYNKIVTDYGANTQLWYLMSRNNLTGEYVDHREQLDSSLCSMPTEYIFNSIEECLEVSIKEGFVIYSGNVPILKIKNPTYIVAHRLRGIIELYASGEKSEYLSYFPEHESLFSEIIHS